MATLVLSTVGTALGGPVGGAIGALIGQSIDQQLLGPKTQGPRLGDLKVQSSSYGTQVPRIYGSMRVAGTVIWATDLVESTQTSGAKGQPDQIYSYSVSLAVALSSRAVKRIGRIWADGKLLRGAAGDFKVATKFRFYEGDDDQEIDALIGSAEGIENTPAYRGLALAVFEDLELADYGNRIPFMTFEAFADDEPVSVGGILSDASGEVVACTDGQQLAGYAAYGQSIGAAIEPLIDCFDVELFDDGSRLVSPVGTVPMQIGEDQSGNSSDNNTAPRVQREQSPNRSLPSSLRLGYYDPALDYQSGQARASSSDRRGTEEQRELPAALDASDAKSLVQTMIAREWARRDKLTLRLPPSFVGLQPGTQVDVDLSPRSWRVEQCTIDGFVVRAELWPTSRSSPRVLADAGRVAGNQDIVASDVILATFDVPDVLQQGSSSPTLLLAASTASPGWKSQAAEVLVGGQSLQAQTARRKTVLGQALTVLGTGDPYLINQAGELEVELIDQDQWLVSCDDEALVGGSNFAVLGSELLQFGAAEPLGQGRFRLTRLLRGRAGTEWAMDTHAVGEPFALIEAEALRAVSLPASAAGASVGVSVRNVTGTTSTCAQNVTGESLRPLSPIALNADTDANGNLDLTWTRRSQQGFAWLDEIDAPLGERLEQYRVTIVGAQDTIEYEVTEPALQIAAAQLASAGAGPATVEVRQIGDSAVSRPARTCINI
jgi:putative tail protein